ncbi:MAG: hypothetical protein RL017_833 [Pseudomonadota bacterium]|jgi:hypothetical protein|nr:hypothetical protein [Burkholderiales bacterium]
MKKFLGFLILVFTANCFATSTIGVTTLYYSNKTQYQNDMNTNVAVIHRINQAVLAAVKYQLANLKPQVQQLIAQTESYSSFDADKTVSDWNVGHANWINIWNQESSTFNNDNATESINSNKNAANGILVANKFILVGWIKNITVNADKQPIANSSKLSILYNLDIQIIYKVIDYNTKQVIFSFPAVGHGGIGRILPVGENQMIDIKSVSDSVVSHAINSLLVNIVHNLEVKQANGLMTR